MKPKLPKVQCVYSRLAKLDTLKPNPANPNKHPVDQLRVFGKILVHQGVRKPAVVSKESGLIVTGHGLVLTLQQLGATTCPIDEQSFAGSKPGQPGPDELAHLLADNSLPQLADLDAGQVAQLTAEVTGLGIDLELTGVLAETSGPVRLEDVATQAPPKFTWVLIGIPTVRFGEISEWIEKISALPDVMVKTTSNDGPKK